jgi:hypothetical protein
LPDPNVRAPSVPKHLLHPTSGRPTPRREPWRPTSDGNHRPHLLPNGRDVIAKISVSLPRPTKPNARPRCKHRRPPEPPVPGLFIDGRFAPMSPPARGLSPRRPSPRWLGCPRSRRSGIGATVAQYPIGWIHHLHRRFPIHGGGLSATAPSSTFDSRPRMLDSQVRSRLRPGTSPSRVDPRRPFPARGPGTSMRSINHVGLTPLCS